MKMTIRVTRKNNIWIWATFTIIFLYWLVLLSTSSIAPSELWKFILLFAAFCFGLPAIGTFFVYVTVDEASLTLPRAVFLRRRIALRDIVALRLRPHAVGLLKDMSVEYKSENGAMKASRLPSFSIFGREQSSELVRSLVKANPAIIIDPKIETLLSKRR